MKKLLLLALLGLAACDVGDPGYVEVEGSGEFAVVGGKAVLTIIPDTVYDTTEVVVEVPVEIPCPDPEPCLPPPEWECPAGWICVPPLEPVGPQIQVSLEQGAWGTPDTVEAGGYYIRLDSQEWADLGISYDGGSVPGVTSVAFYLDGVRSNSESLYPYEVNPRTTNLVAGSLEIEARVAGDSAYSVFDTVVIVNPNLPPEPPPDTVPVPPDTVPPVPEVLKQFGWRSDLGQWLGTTLKDDTLPPGDYVFFLELRNRDSWDGVDSVVIGLAEQTTFIMPREHVPMDANDGTVTFEPDKFYLLPYTVWGAGGNEFGVIEGTKANVHILPDLTGMLIPLDAPTNLRIEMDTLSTWALGPSPIVRWDPSPQNEQGIQCEAPEWGTEDHCRPVNDPAINGDEVYSLLRVYDLAGTEIGMDCNPFGQCWVNPEPFQNLVSWDYAIPTPDTIRACVRFEAWDCHGCVGPGGQIPPYENEWGNMTWGIPISETTCTILEVS